MRGQVFKAHSSWSTLLSSGPRQACKIPDSKPKYSVQLTAHSLRTTTSSTHSALPSIRHCAKCFAWMITFVPHSIYTKGDTIMIIFILQVRKLRLTEANLVVRPNSILCISQLILLTTVYMISLSTAHQSSHQSLIISLQCCAVSEHHLFLSLSLGRLSPLQGLHSSSVSFPRPS